MSRQGNVPLPIDPLLPEIVGTLAAHGVLVLEAPPGAGKTTRVPRALLGDPGLEGEILVLQPRRLPTRLAAQRVAEELGEEVGGRVGYAVRFENVSGRSTRLRFLTEGLLIRRLVDDPLLEGVGAVVLDEFHERNLAADLSLALVRNLQKEKRPDLRLLVMSATLDAEPIAGWLGAPRIRSEGRLFELTIEHQEKPDDRPLPVQAAGAVRRLIGEGLDGDILVFLPGAGEIRRTLSELEPLAEARDLLVLPLHGDLPLAEQNRAVRPASQRKVILSTNVAETSVTIEGIAAVVDTGLVRMAGHSPWTGLPHLETVRISKASAIQRAGRAGRTRAGRVVRLYTRHDFAGMRDHDSPEIQRSDLSQTLLDLYGAGVDDPARFPFFEAPTPAALEAAGQLLERLGAVVGGRPTDLGRKLATLPLHPRLGKLVLEGARAGVGADAATVAALLSERDIRLASRATFGGGGKGRNVGGSSDLLELLARFSEAERMGFARDRLRSAGLDPQAVESVDKVRKQLLRLLPQKQNRLRGDAAEEALLKVILSAFSDRVARRRTPTGRDLVLSGGGAAILSEASVVHDATFLVAVDVEERRGAAGRTGTVRLASAIEADWLVDLPGSDLGESETWVWNAQSRRVDKISRITWGAISLEESRAPAPPGPETSKLLAEEAWARGIHAFAPDGALEQLLARIEWLARLMPEAGLPQWGAEDLKAVLEAACEGLRSFADLEEAGLVNLLLQRLTGEQQRLLATQMPEKIGLPGGRSVKVHYQPGLEPWIESRLQDFFGMTKGPSLCGGRLPITLHLLAPNMRAVQVTKDLEGFWERHYPSIRKELGRRYPRHAWPEDGRTATPPAPRRR